MPDVTEPGLHRILAEEANLANEANAERERLAAEARREAALRRVALGVALGLPFLCLLLVGVARFRDRVPDVPHRLPEPPEPNLHPPQLAAEWARVHRQKAAANAFRAQLLHLVRERVADLRAEGFVTRTTSFRVEVGRCPTRRSTSGSPTSSPPRRGRSS